MERQTILSEKTLVPVGILAILFGAAMWLTTIWKQGEANATQIQEVKTNQMRDIDKIYEKLDKISDKLDQLIEKNSK